MLLRYLEQHSLPFTVEIETGKKMRSDQQNRLQQKWFTEAAEQLEESAEYWRAYCKLHFGVPIRRNASEKFRKAYDSDLRDLPYELKMKLMVVPYDLPVTRDMNTKQMKEYLDTIQKFFAEKGVVLTDPESAKWKQFEADNDRGRKKKSSPPPRET